MKGSYQISPKRAVSNLHLRQPFSRELNFFIQMKLDGLEIAEGGGESGHQPHAHEGTSRNGQIQLSDSIIFVGIQAVQTDPLTLTPCQNEAAIGSEDRLRAILGYDVEAEIVGLHGVIQAVQVTVQDQILAGLIFFDLHGGSCTVLIGPSAGIQLIARGT